MIGPLALAIAVLAGSPADRTGYGNATWGMSLPQVRSLYSGGFSEDLGGGLLEYRIVTRFEDGRRSIVMFRFGSTGLMAVLVAFPRRGTSVNLRTNEFFAEADDEAARTLVSVRRVLAERYGQPLVTWHGILRWQVKDGGWVSLQRIEYEKGRAAIGILYTNPRLQPDDVPQIAKP